MKKRILSIMLAIAMLACMIPLGMVTASAATTITYIDSNGIEQTTSSYYTLTSYQSTYSGVYYLTGTYSFNGGTLTGDTIFIVAGDANYTFYTGLIGSGCNLYIFNVKGSNSGCVTINGSAGSAGSAGANGIESYNRYQYADRCGKAGGGGIDGNNALAVRNLKISNVTVTCTGGQGGQGGRGGTAYDSGSTGYPGAGGDGGNGGYGGHAILATGIDLYGGTLTAIGGRGGNGGKGGRGGYNNIYNDNHGGKGGNGGLGCSAIYFFSSGNANIKGNGTLNATSGQGGNGGNGGSGGSSQGSWISGGNGGNGGTGGSSYFSIYSAYGDNIINVYSGKATIQVGNYGSGGSGGTKGTGGFSGDKNGANGSSGSLYYAVNNKILANSFDTLAIHRGGSNSSDAIGWVSSSITAYRYIYVENMTYLVTLNNQGAETSGTTSITATYGSAMPTATMPTKTGYTFNGYYDAISGGTKYYNADGTSAKNWNKYAAATLYAQWAEQVEAPTVSGDKDNMFIYTGEEIVALKSTDAYTVTDGSATDAGKYTATVTLKNGYIWSDGKNDAKTVEWEILSEIDSHLIGLVEHTPVKDEAVPAICTEAGLTEGSHCSVCGKVLVAQQKVPATGHDYVNHDAQTATCTDIGWDAYQTCTRCDYTSYKEIPATGVHTYEITDNLLQCKYCQYLYTGKYDEKFYKDGVETDKKNGIVEEDGELYYYEDDVKVAKGMVRSENDYYFFGISKKALKDGTYTLYNKLIDGVKPGQYTFDKDGKMQFKNGIYEEDGELYYYENNVRVAKGMVKDGDDYYYFGTSKKALKDGTYTLYNKLIDGFKAGEYTFDKDGKMVYRNGIVEEDGELYYYENEVRVAKGMVKDGDDYYYFGTSKKALKDGTYTLYNKLIDGFKAGKYTFGTDGKMIIA